MSVQTLYTAATGMDAMETKLDVIANNLANVNTTAFKKGRTNFEDLFYRHEVMPGAEDQSGGITATGTSIGLGTTVSSIQTDFRQGAFLNTGNKLDVAIVGNGFFQVQDTDGSTVYTRAGNFSINRDGALVIGSASVGRLLEPSITLPEGYIPDSVAINSDGEVQFMLSGDTEPQVAGQLELATFINPEGLIKRGENLFAESGASGTAAVCHPRRGRGGTVECNDAGSVQCEPGAGTD
jgi:flagellar basal-body rod protein FlgG